MTVTELLKLVPFSIGTITILLASGGLIFGHAYGRYGDDAAISFLFRLRFLLAAASILPVPIVMLVSFGRDKVPHWVDKDMAAELVGLGITSTMIVVGYLLVSVSRPGMFLGSVGRRISVRKLNRYAVARRWRNDPEDFRSDVAGYEYRLRGDRVSALAGERSEPGTAANARWRVIKTWLHLRRSLLKLVRSDPSEMLFDAAAAGLKNGNMRTWRSALEVTGRRLRSPGLSEASAEIVVANALALEERAHGQGSEDCKMEFPRLSGQVGAFGESLGVGGE